MRPAAAGAWAGWGVLAEPSIRDTACIGWMDATEGSGREAAPTPFERRLTAFPWDPWLGMYDSRREQIGIHFTTKA